jgi:hypothetical protein
MSWCARHLQRPRGISCDGKPSLSTTDGVTGDSRRLLQLVADMAFEGFIAKQIDDLYATDPIASALRPTALLWSHRNGLCSAPKRAEVR